MDRAGGRRFAVIYIGIGTGTETIMKNRTLIAALVLTLSGCVSLGEYAQDTPLPVHVYRCPLELRTVDGEAAYSTGRLLAECEYDPDIRFLHGDTYRGLRVLESEDYPDVRFIVSDTEDVRYP